LTPKGVGVQNTAEDQGEDERFHSRRASLLVFSRLMFSRSGLALERITKAKDACKPSNSCTKIKFKVK
jgi:hypothetical protein